MANTERYRFDVDAETGKAVSKLKEVAQLMDKIDRLHSKGIDNYNTTNQKDVDKSMRSMSELSKSYQAVKKDLMEIQRNMQNMADSIATPVNATKAQREEIEKLRQAYANQANEAMQSQQELRKSYDQTLRKYREMASFTQNYSKTFKSKLDTNDVFNLPTGSENSFKAARQVMQDLASDADRTVTEIDKVKQAIQEANKLDRRSESLSRRAKASNYMSYQQATSFKGDYRTATQDFVRKREANMDSMTELGRNRSELSRRVNDIQNKPDASKEDLDKKIQLEESIRAIDKEMETRIQLNRTLEKTTANMERYNKSLLENGGVEVKPERGTMSGMMYERAPAIGLALTGAVAGTMASLYNQGAGLNRSMRDDVISIGQHTGTQGADWRSSIRDNALDAGLSKKLGFSGQEMLNFQQNYLSNNGFTNMDDLNSAMRNQAIFSRTTGVDAASTQQFFQSAMQTGAVNGSQVKDIQDAFIGAIKQSGMEGREKDQLKALQGLLGSVSNGRSMTNDEVMNVMGLQSVLANTGVRSLQGEQGGQLLSQLNDGLRQGFDDPQTRLLFGAGTKYQGLSGMYDLQKQMEQGIANPELLNNLFGAAETQANGGDIKAQKAAFSMIVRQKLGTDITTDQIDGLYEARAKGDLTKEGIDKALKGNKETGSKTGDEKLKQYQDSHEAIDNQSESTTEKQATQLYDLGEVVRKTNAAMAGMPPALYASVIALSAFTLALGASTASMFGGKGVRGLFKGKYKGAGGGGGKGPKGGGGGGGTPPIVDAKGNPVQSEKKGWMGRTKDTVGGWFGRGNSDKPNVPKTEGAPKGFWAGVGDKTKGFLGGAKDKAGGFFSATKDKVGGWFSKGNGSGIIENGGKGGGWMSKLGKAGGVLGKVALPLSIATGAAQILTAKEGEKGKAIGSVGGGILGGMGGGAAAGAALGSVVPGLGTVIGGIGGSIVGGIAGSGIGGWIGSKFDGGGKKLESPEEVAAAKETLHKAFTIGEDKEGKETNKAKGQLDKENTNTKSRTETKRGDNIALEKENLKLFETLLNRTEALLTQARMQNGIMGTMQNGGGVMGSDGTMLNGSAGQVSGNDNASQIWNFLAGKGMNPGAISGILGNLQQESNLDPTAPNGGLAQWLGPRRKGLENFAKESGGDVNSLDTQLNYMWKELSSGQFGNMEELNKLNPTEAAKYFEQHYEKAGKPMMEKRIGYANQWYNQLGGSGGAQLQSNAGTKSTNNGTNNKVSVNSNINVKVSGDEKASDKVKDSKELKGIASAIQQKIYGSLGFHSKETERA